MFYYSEGSPTSLLQMKARSPRIEPATNLCLAGGENSCERNLPPVYFHRAGWKAGDDVPARSVAGNAVVDFNYLSVGENGPRGAQSMSEVAELR